MLDYLSCYKRELPVSADWGALASWDVFISAYNDSQRVKTAFEKAPATIKHWLLLPEYAYTEQEYPTGGSLFAPDKRHEAEFVNTYLSESNLLPAIESRRICIDITGFMRPQLLFLLARLRSLGVRRIDAIYSEPDRYGKREETSFSEGSVYEVRPVAGFEGSHETDISSDVLVIAVGYDHELIAHAIAHKDHALVVPVFGLPSLRAEMYQESRLRLARVGDAMGGKKVGRNFFAPANDPFVTAAALDEILSFLGDWKNRNLYLCPLATKPQTLGFGLAYLRRLAGRPASIVYPFRERYKRETSFGHIRTWCYEVPLE